MKREKVYCLLFAIIVALLIFVLTFQVIPQFGAIPIFIGYFAFTFVISISSLGIIKKQNKKENWCGIFVGVDALIMIIDFIIGCFGKIDDELIRNIVLIIFIISFFLFVILCGYWSKLEKTK